VWCTQQLQSDFAWDASKVGGRRRWGGQGKEEAGKGGEYTPSVATVLDQTVWTASSSI
jgi:hypothetical protein